jgi:uncharacterized metal-binding protein
MEVDWLVTVTSVVSLRDMGVDWLVDTVTSVVYLGVWGLTGLIVTSVVYLGGVDVEWLDTVTSVVFLGCIGVDWLDTVTAVVYL